MGINNVLLKQSMGNTPSKLINLGGAASSKGVTVIPGDSTVIIKVRGPHFVIGHLSFQHEDTDDGDVYHLEIYKNGFPTGYRVSQYLDAGATDLHSVSVFGILEDMLPGDFLDLRMYTDEAGPSTIAVVDCQFGVVSL